MKDRSGWLHGLAIFSVRRPGAVIGLWAVIAAVSLAGVLNLKVDTATASFFDRSAGAWKEYQASLQSFGGDEIVVVAIEGSEAFDPSALKTVIQLTDRFADLPGVRRVDSISSVPVIESTVDGALSLSPPLRSDFVGLPEQISRLERLLSFDRIAPRNLISSDNQVFAINVILDEDVDHHREFVVSQIRDATRGMPVRFSGVPVFRTEVNFETFDELRIFVPLTTLLVGFIVLAATRRVASVGICLSTSGLGILVMLGAMGFNGTPISLSTMILPSIMLALGCAYVMHVIASAADVDSREGIQRGVLMVTRPVALSGLTTAIGFLSMASVRIGAIRELAVFGSLGVLVILLATLTFAPALMCFFLGHGDERFRSRKIVRIARTKIVFFAVRSPRMTIAIWAIIGAGFSFGLTQLRVETDIIQWFSEKSEIRMAYEKIRESLSGITPVNIVIQSQNGLPVTSPDLIAAVDGLSAFLNQLPVVGRAVSVADPLIQIHGGFSEGEYGELPSRQAEIAQYLFLLSSVELMEDVISPDHLSTNVVLRLNQNGSREIVDLSEKVRRWWHDHGVSGFSADLTGVMYEFGRAEEEIAHGQIRGLALAFSVIAGILLFIFRKPRIALAALIPNLTPLVITYGFMGAMGIPLDAATICLGSLALGIAVDDTIHVTHGFSEEVQKGHSPETAVDLAVAGVVAPLFYSTVAIAVGFAVLGVSGFTLIQHLGILTAAMVLVCLIADLTLLPALLVEFSEDSEKRSAVLE